MAVVVVRGDIVRRYPTAHFFLQQAAYVKPEERESIDGTEGEVEPVEGTETEPDFLGSLGPDTVFFGFSQLDSDVVRGNRPDPDAPGYFFVIEEQAGAPRFGLDEAKPAHFDPRASRRRGTGPPGATSPKARKRSTGSLTRAPTTSGSWRWSSTGRPGDTTPHTWRAPAGSAPSGCSSTPTNWCSP